MNYENQFTLDFQKLLQRTLLILAIGILAIAGWSHLAPISSATLAPGHIRTEGTRQTLQHHDRGVVESVLVENGDYVEQGQLLIQLDTKDLLAVKRSTMEELLVTSLELTRNQAIITETDALTISDELRSLANTLNTPQAITIAEKTWLAHRQELANQQHILSLQQQQASQQIEGKQQELKNIRKQLELVNADVKAFAALSKKDFVSQSQHNKVHANAIMLERVRTNALAEVNQLQTRVIELQQQQEHLQDRYTLKAIDNYRQLLNQRARLQKELTLLDSRLQRTRIQAPIAGRISQLRINAIGSTIEPDMMLMEIIPAHAELIVEAKVKPEDIESINQNNTAQIRLSAYNARHTPLVDADIISLSPDTLVDERGIRYYTLTLAIDKHALAQQPQLTLYPGMPAEAIIHNGTRTLMDYLLGSLRTYSERSLREGNS
jgi:HlyD family type I secretion membrane fusion protein